MTTRNRPGCEARGQRPRMSFPDRSCLYIEKFIAFDLQTLINIRVATTQLGASTRLEAFRARDQASAAITSLQNAKSVIILDQVHSKVTDNSTCRVHESDESSNAQLALSKPLNSIFCASLRHFICISALETDENACYTS